MSMSLDLRQVFLAYHQSLCYLVGSVVRICGSDVTLDPRVVCFHRFNTGTSLSLNVDLMTLVTSLIQV